VSEPPSLALAVNGRQSGSFECNDGIVFAVNVANPGSHQVQVESLSLELQSESRECETHQAPISSDVSKTVPPGATLEIRRVDLAGDLCRGTAGPPGCAWRAIASSRTSQGMLSDEIRFETMY